MSRIQRIASPIEDKVAAPASGGSFAGLLRARRRAEIQAFLVALRDPSLTETVVNDSEALASILDLAIGDYGVQQKELAEHLNVSPAAVGRWRNNENAPRAYARTAVLASLDALIARQLATELLDKEPAETREDGPVPQPA